MHPKKIQSTSSASTAAAPSQADGNIQQDQVAISQVRQSEEEIQSVASETLPSRVTEKKVLTKPSFSLFAELKLDSPYLAPSNEQIADFILGHSQHSTGVSIDTLFADSNAFFSHFAYASLYATLLFPTNEPNQNHVDCPVVNAKTRRAFSTNPLLRGAHRRIAGFCLANFGLTVQNKEVLRHEDLPTKKPAWIEASGAEDRALLLDMIKSLALLGNEQLAANICVMAELCLNETGLLAEARSFQEYRVVIERNAPKVVKKGALPEEAVDKSYFRGREKRESRSSTSNQPQSLQDKAQSKTDAVEAKIEETDISNQEVLQNWASTLYFSSANIRAIWSSVLDFVRYIESNRTDFMTRSDLSKQDKDDLLALYQWKKEEEQGSFVVLEKKGRIATSPADAQPSSLSSFTSLAMGEFDHIFASTDSLEEIANFLAQRAQQQCSKMSLLRSWLSEKKITDIDLAVDHELQEYAQINGLVLEHYCAFSQKNSDGVLIKRLIPKAYVDYPSYMQGTLNALREQNEKINKIHSPNNHIELCISTMSDLQETQDFIRENLTSTDYSGANFIQILKKEEDDEESLEKTKDLNYFVAVFANDKKIRFCSRQATWELRAGRLIELLEKREFGSLKDLIMPSYLTEKDAFIISSTSALKFNGLSAPSRAIQESLYEALRQLSIAGVPLAKIFPVECPEDI